MERNEATCPICSQADHKLSCPHRDGGQLMLSANRDQTPEAERLIQALQAHIEGPDRLTMDDAIALRDELRRLSAENPILHSCIESLTETVKDKEAEIARLVEDRARFPDRPDDVPLPDPMWPANGRERPYVDAYSERQLRSYADGLAAAIDQAMDGK